MKLSIELVPASMWGENLRKYLQPKYWTNLRKNIYRLAGHRCEICGKAGRVECHETWEFDDAHSVQRLVGCKALCKLCHMAKHFGRSVTTGESDRVIEHIMRVNGWEPWQLAHHIEISFARFNRRSTRAWAVDISWLADNEQLLQPHR